jgi:hypothetical protein
MSKKKNKELAFSLEMMEVFYVVNGIEGILMEPQRRRILMAFLFGGKSREPLI